MLLKVRKFCPWFALVDFWLISEHGWGRKSWLPWPLCRLRASLLQLSSKAQFNENVKPLALAGNDDGSLPKLCVVSGWGRSHKDTKYMSLVLMEVNVTLIDYKLCTMDGFYCSQGETGPAEVNTFIHRSVSRELQSVFTVLCCTSRETLGVRWSVRTRRPSVWCPPTTSRAQESHPYTVMLRYPSITAGSNGPWHGMKTCIDPVTVF